jgi:tripartite-type tricarboxylate transporter receptor subunit TctC
MGEAAMRKQIDVGNPLAGRARDGEAAEARQQPLTQRKVNFHRTLGSRLPGRKSWLRGLVLFLVLGIGLLFAGGASAQEEKYPSRPIDVICIFGAGGGLDSMAREITSLTQPILGVALPVSNVAGASGNMGIAQLLSAKPDGYTIAAYVQDTMMTIPMGLARHKLNDLEFIVRTQVADSFLFVKSNSPFKTIKELFDYAKANPGKLRVAGTGFGSPDDVTVKFLKSKGYPMTLVGYPKPGERYAAALGGHTEVLYEQAGDVKQYIEAGQIKPLIVFAHERFPAFPDVPCSQELGLDITLPQFRGMITAKGVPADRVNKLAESMHKAMETPEWKKFCKDWYIRPDSYLGPKEYGEWVAKEVATLNKFVKELGIKK